MDESTIEKLSQVKIVEPDNQTKFRKKGSNAIKMTGPTFLQFLFAKKQSSKIFEKTSLSASIKVILFESTNAPASSLNFSLPKPQIIVFLFLSISLNASSALISKASDICFLFSNACT